MSNEAASELTKEQKRAKKEEKRAKKAAKASTGQEAGSSAPPAEPVVEDGVKEKKKKDKKEKRKAEAEIDVPTTGDVGSEEPKKKKKKESQSTATPGEFTKEHNDYLSTNAITLLPPIYPPHLSIPSLPVNPSIAKFLTRFTTPTPIQACSWPPLLANRDVVGIAETGSGKTLGFGVPGLQKLSLSLGQSKKNNKGKGVIRMLVIAPTRELALQSHETILALGEELGVGSVCVYGGVGKDEQIRGLRDGKTGVVVGTPGRMLDLADQGDLDLSKVEYLVLDEADRMLDQGFENDIRRIIAHCPGKEGGRQTVMFSATWPESVRRLASTFLNDAVRITVGSDELTANKRIEQIVEVLEPYGKDVRLLHHLKTHLKSNPSTTAQPTRILVFALYKKEAQRLESTIKRAGYSTAGLHGDLSQDARFKALDKFKSGGVNVLVATDVAARGLDIPDVGLVINVTFPLTTEDFVHRCGRTGRAGKTGKAVTFFTGEGHEKALAGEFMRVIRDAGGEVPKEMDRFPSTIKKKEHGSYGAFYKDTTNAPAPTKITFD